MPELLSMPQQLAAFTQLGVFRSCQSFSQKQSQSHQYIYDGWMAALLHYSLITGYLHRTSATAIYPHCSRFYFPRCWPWLQLLFLSRYYRVFIIPENDVRFGEHKFFWLNTIKHKLKEFNMDVTQKYYELIGRVDGFHPPQFIVQKCRIRKP